MTLSLRTDMWRFWLREAIDAAVVADVVADEIPLLYEQFEAGNATEEGLDDFPGTTVTAKRFKHPACNSLCTSTCRPANALPAATPLDRPVGPQSVASSFSPLGDRLNLVVVQCGSGSRLVHEPSARRNAHAARAAALAKNRCRWHRGPNVTRGRVSVSDTVA